MAHRVITGRSFAQLYQSVLDELFIEPHYETAPRGQKIVELTNCLLVLQNPYSNLYTNPARSVIERYLAGELLFYFRGSNKLEEIAKYSKFWNNIANADGTVNSAYGHLLFNDPNAHGFTEWAWAVDSLKKDKDSRQAIIRFNRPNHSFEGNKDFVCTLVGVFQIRRDMLHLTVNMRSNDVHFGLTYDLPFFTLLQQQMRLHLLPTYPDLKLGYYYHFANSLHIYERNFTELQAMRDQYTSEAALPRMQESFVSTTGSPRQALLAAAEGKYEGDDQLLNWLQEKAQ